MESLLLCANEAIGDRVQQAREVHAQQPQTSSKTSLAMKAIKEKNFTPCFIKK